MLDRYWHETVEFVKAQPAWPCAVIGPWEMRSVLRETTPYEQASAGLLRQPCYLVIHKGMIDAIDDGLLYQGMLAGRLVFSNEVFLVLDLSEPITEHLRHTNSFVAALSRRSQETPGPAGTSSPSSCYLGGSRALCKSVHGHKLLVDTRDLSLTPHLLTDGYWEHWITDFIARTVEPGWRVIEVGANYGYYTLLLADLVGPSGHVTAFEANPTIASLLSNNIEINGFRDRARGEQFVVADAAGRDVRFRVWKNHIASSGLFATLEQAERFGDSLEEMTLKTTSLDQYFAQGTKVDFIKMDAEGAEPLILRGAERLLRENCAIKVVIEFVPENIAATMDPEAFLDSLSALGFGIFRIDEDATARDKDRAELLSKPHSELFLGRAA